MDFQETLDYLYHKLPVFQKVGVKALNLKLENTINLCRYLGAPQSAFPTIHIAGTNGKGSVAHMLTSILMESGYKVGLYTSPHLKSFTERIKINGTQVPESFVIDFVQSHKKVIETWGLSFFELTVGMCFEYFKAEEVEVAVIETGMGGRLDSTNIITPELSVITNVSKDHEQYLGDTIKKITFEKAGIIKPNIPVVVGEKNDEVESVIEEVAEQKEARVVKAYKYKLPDSLGFESYQIKNGLTALTSARELRDKFQGINDQTIITGLRKYISNTGLKGRWQQLSEKPLVICDTGHNLAGISEVVSRIKNQTYEKLFYVFGTVNDKDISAILELLPKEAKYYFCQAKIDRAMKARDLSKLAKGYGLSGVVIEDVNEAIDQAKEDSSPRDLIMIGGSTFVVAEIRDL